VGLLFFQKALLVLPVLVLLAFALFADGGPVARLRHLVRRYWPALVMVGGLAAAYAVYSLTEVRQPFTGGRGVDMASLAWNTVSSAALAAWGGPWFWDWRPGGSAPDAPVWLEAATVVATVLFAVYTLVLRRRAGWAWLLLTGYIGMQVALVATSRAPLIGVEIGALYRLQTDVVCALVLALGLALLPVRDAVATVEPRSPGAGGVRPPPVRWLVAGVVAVAVSGTLCWTLYAVSWHQHNDGERYVRTLDRQLEREGRTFLADQAVPDSVMPGEFFAPDGNRVSVFTRLLGRPVEFPTATPRLAVVADNGRLHHAELDPATQSEPGPVPGCGWPGEAPQLRVPLPARTFDLAWWVRIGYLSTSSDRVVVEIGEDRLATHVTEGLGTLFLRTTGSFDEVLVTDLDPGTRLCVDVVEVGDLVVGPAL
jgi:hypothetical protein